MAGDERRKGLRGLDPVDDGQNDQGDPCNDGERDEKAVVPHAGRGYGETGRGCVGHQNATHCSPRFRDAGPSVPATQRTQSDAPSPALLNRELSWLDLNARVLDLAADPDEPLLERVKYCSIFSS
ncbi:MAG: hypothetical protein HOQ28_03820, partial [Thermoleophilia bacterium]|nr:hypothetical protein [Thermoleophilia bacterium]